MLHLLAILLLTSSISAIERSRGALGPKIFTFVHGDDSAKMDFATADRYCHQVVGSTPTNSETMGIIGDGDSPGFGTSYSDTYLNSTRKDDLVLQTRLAAIHSYPESSAILKWISKQEEHSFWIGGKITKTLNEYLKPIYILQWNDGSTSDFSFLRLPSSDLSSIRVGEQRCVAVDYVSGQWGVHPCVEKRYFLCLTVPVLKTSAIPSGIPKRRRKVNSQPVWQERTFQKPGLKNQRELSADELRSILS